MFSAWYQLANMTYDRGCLQHDDRADAVEGVVRDLSAYIGLDEEKAQAARTAQQAKEHMQNPMGYSDSAFMKQQQRGRGVTRMARSRR